MRKILLPLAVGCLSLSFAFFPPFKAGSKNATITITSVKGFVVTTDNNSAKGDKNSVLKAAGTILYDSLQLGKLGLSYD
ncbi:MAG TPA: hypothetical protein VM888_02020, partial [Chitinophagaceae bacterium]|nr:hypothetical protein [Chitinophagaceae bacterium]